jgi:thioredoxin 1
MQLLTNENFATATGTGIAVVDFFATRCGPCKMIAPYLEQMATQFAGKVDFYKVDVDEQPYLSASQGIRAMPTLKVFRNGNIEETIV